MPYNKGENKGKKPTDTATPIWLCDFMYKLLSSKFDDENKTILDPCSGDDRLTNNFIKSKKINYEIKKGTDFLKEDEKINCDLVIMNPPFNAGTGRKLCVEVFMDKLLSLIDNNTPIFMICPMGFRLNQRKTSERWKKIRDTYPEITTIISLPVDTFENTLYHAEIVCFNTSFLKSHYWIDNIK